MFHLIVQVSVIIAGRLIHSAGVPFDSIFQLFYPRLILFFIIILASTNHSVFIRLRDLQCLDARLPQLLVIVLTGIRLGDSVNDIVAKLLLQLFQLLNVISLREA